jgi:hypothetical protein
MILLLAVAASTRAVPAADPLHACLADHLGVRISRRACCPEHRSPVAAFTDAYFARSPVAAWVASHGCDHQAVVDDVSGTGHLPDSVWAMALAGIGAAPKTVMTGRLSA